MSSCRRVEIGGKVCGVHEAEADRRVRESRLAANERRLSDIHGSSTRSRSTGWLEQGCGCGRWSSFPGEAHPGRCSATTTMRGLIGGLIKSSISRSAGMLKIFQSRYPTEISKVGRGIECHFPKGKRFTSRSMHAANDVGKGNRYPLV